MNVNDIVMPEHDPSGKMAQMVADLRFEDIPEEHVDYVKKDILDALGCIIAGSTAPSVDTTIRMASDMGGEGKGKILVFGTPASADLAAFANGTMARARDLGDTHNKGGHITEWIVPTLMSGLCTDDAPRSGKDFITAFVGGAEWGAREHVCIHLQFHTTVAPGECAGSRYATGALAKLEGLSQEEIWSAQGIVFSMHPQSEEQKYNEGSLMARLQHGFVASDALKAVYLAKNGIQGIRGIYMGESGLLKNIRHGDTESPDFLTEDLGKRWVWREEVTMKPYAGCKYQHTPIYGLLSMMKEYGFRWQDIENVHFVVSAGCRCTIEPEEEKWNPQDSPAAMFSNPYAVAYSAMTGDCFLDAFEEETIRERMASPEFRELMSRLSYEVDPNIPPFDDYRIQVTLKDGRTFDKIEDRLLGNVKNPMTWEQVEHKFWNCTKYAAVDLGKEKYQKIIDICRNMEQIQDIHELLEAMLP